MTEKGIEFESVNYLEHPPSAEELKRLLRAAGVKPRNALRTKEAAYKQYVGDRDLSDDELIRIMAAHPEIIQRPIVVRGSRAVLARPANRLDDLEI